MNSLQVRSTMPYWKGKLLKAALAMSGELRLPLATTWPPVGCLPLLCARSPVTGLETSWQKPQKLTSRWKFDFMNWCRASALL